MASVFFKKIRKKFLKRLTIKEKGLGPGAQKTPQQSRNTLDNHNNAALH